MGQQHDGLSTCHSPAHRRGNREYDTKDCCSVTSFSSHVCSHVCSKPNPANVLPTDACPGSEGDSPSYRAAPATAGADAGPESEDAWADRMWRDMGARRRQAMPRAQHGAGSAEARAAANETAAARRRAAEAAVFESARILKEEQTKDSAWRRRTVQGQVRGKNMS